MEIIVENNDTRIIVRDNWFNPMNHFDRREIMETIKQMLKQLSDNQNKTNKEAEKSGI